MFGKRFSLRWVACAAIFGAALGVLLPRERLRRAPAPRPPSAVGTAPSSVRSTLEEDSCARELEAIASAPALAGSPLNGGEQRAYLLARAKAEPVIFDRTPENARPLSALAVELRRELYGSEAPFEAFPRV